MKKMMAAMMVVAMTIPAMATVYNYGSTASLTDGSWGTSPQWSGDYAGAIFKPTLESHQMRFTQNLGYGENIANRGAYFWTAPEGEVITGVSFYWWRGGVQTDFKTAVYAKTDAATALQDADLAWSTNGGATYADGTQTVNFDASAGIKSVGLGFTDVWSDTTCDVLYNTISVTTAAVPEPVSLVILGLGGLAGWLRKTR